MAHRSLSLLLLLVCGMVVGGDFTSIDISTGLSGSTVSVGSEGFDITGSGGDIWNESDSFRFHYQQVSGDFDIRSRISQIQNINPWSKAGVAIRQSLAPNSVHAMTVATPGNGFAFQYRTVEGGSSSHVAGGGTFYPFSWVRLVRIGQTVSSYKSVDPAADEWEFIGSVTLETVDPVYVGLVVTSHNDSALCKAEFRNVDLHTYVAPVSGTGDGLSAQYFNSRDLSGAAVLSRVDPQVNFNWTTGSPDAAISSDNFSISWRGQVQAQFSEEYTFYTVSDDGIRLWLNGELVIDHWTDHSRTENRTLPISLVAGHKYEIVAEFFENGGYAESRLLWASRSTLKEPIPQGQLYSTAAGPIIGVGSGLKGEYFAGREFGAKVLTRLDSTVDFTWDTGEPFPGAGANDFAVRWTGLVEPTYTGEYTFYTESDDGVRLWIDNQLIINNWTDHGAAENKGKIALSAGKKFAVRMDFYENSGQALAKLLWSSVAQAKEVIPTSQLYPGQGTGLFAEYYDNADLTNLKYTRVDATINFDWASSAPAASLGSDTFSVRWTGRVEPLFTEAYTFYTVSDDGVRLWINGQLVIDNWTDHSATENTSAPIQVYAGVPLDVKMEFYENGGDATAKLLWSSASQPKQPVPSTQLQPNGGLLLNVPIASAVSPAFIEGVCWSPTNQPFTIDGTGTSVIMLSNSKFFTNLNLSSEATTSVTFTHSGTGVSQNGTVTWTATDISGKEFSQEQILLRKGDSLLLTVSGTNESISIDLNGGAAEFTGLANDKFQAQFNSPGVYIVEGRSNGLPAGTILVSVVDVPLPLIACEIGFRREKVIPVEPSGLASSVVFQAVDPSTLDVTIGNITTDGAQLILSAKRLGTPVLTSRLGSPNGPIISFTEIQDFSVKVFNRTVVRVDEDGFGECALEMWPLVDNIDFDLSIFASTSTFEDGTTSLIRNSNSFESLVDPESGIVYGRMTYVLSFPVQETRACLAIKEYQPSSVAARTISSRSAGSSEQVGQESGVNPKKYYVNLTIHNGQFGPPIPEKKEVNPGAFTVANFNDTDGDHILDYLDDSVVATARGRDELDLMKLIIHKPSPDEGGNVDITIDSTVPVKLWKFPNKIEEVTARSFPTSELDKTVWVEILSPSVKLRDVAIKATYHSASDSVIATGIWSNKGNFRTEGNSLSPDDNGGSIGALFVYVESPLGASHNTPMLNGIEMEFTVTPPGIGNEVGIVFDISRQKEGRTRLYMADQTTKDIEPSDFPVKEEEPNDDKDQEDEDNFPTNNHIYSFDAPGFNPEQTFIRGRRQHNFNEFVRVYVNGEMFQNKEHLVEASRCSSYAPWYSRMDFILQNGSYIRNPAGENEVKDGHKALGF